MHYCKVFEMDYLKIIEKYYDRDSELYRILINHSRDVADKALAIAEKHPELNLDMQFIEEAAMLHDIGVFMTNAPSIFCNGEYAYILHGCIGSEIMRNEGYERHALVCERHTGCGISKEMIVKQNLPLPLKDYLPVSYEEQLICFADKFFSKTKLNQEKSLDKVYKSLEKFGEDTIARFEKMCKIFL